MPVREPRVLLVRLVVTIVPAVQSIIIGTKMLNNVLENTKHILPFNGFGSSLM